MFHAGVWLWEVMTRWLWLFTVGGLFRAAMMIRIRFLVKFGDVGN